MQLVGRAANAAGRHLLIVECDSARLPRLYSQIIDRRRRSVGMIVEVFGNIAHPYAAVICHREARPLVGEKVFAKEQGVKECRKSRS